MLHMKHKVSKTVRKIRLLIANQTFWLKPSGRGHWSLLAI